MTQECGRVWKTSSSSLLLPPQENIMQTADKTGPEIGLERSSTLGPRRRAVPFVPALFAEELASSFEAYLDTRVGKEEVDEDAVEEANPKFRKELKWYLDQLDVVLPHGDAAARLAHPKVRATAAGCSISFGRERW
jgi:hypothetical protein